MSKPPVEVHVYLLILNRSSALAARHLRKPSEHSGNDQISCKPQILVSSPFTHCVHVQVTEAEDPQSSRLRGLLVRDFAKNTTQHYEPAMEAVELLPGKEHAIRLANVTCANAGLYSCFLAAPVREQNREGRVQLIVAGESGVPGVS